MEKSVSPPGTCHPQPNLEVLTWLLFLGGDPFTKLVRQDQWNTLKL